MSNQFSCSEVRNLDSGFVRREELGRSANYFSLMQNYRLFSQKTSSNSRVELGATAVDGDLRIISGTLGVLTQIMDAGDTLISSFHQGIPN